MPSPLTTDDLDGLGADAMTARDPRPYATELLAAVDEERLADPDDAGFALSLAAEIRERTGDQEGALALSARAVTAGAETLDAHWLRSTHAERLLRLGRVDEGMAELGAMRPLLHRTPGVSRGVVDALRENGRAELAEQWLTAALLTAMEREDRATPGSDEADEAEAIVEDLVLDRRAVRGDLGLPPDEYDALADEIADEPDLVFWPRAAFAELIAAQPDAADDLGGDWDAHRADLERELQDADADGFVLDVEIATPALLAAVLAGAEDDVVAPEPGPRVAWPPGRNDPCWCGSRTKYKKCCRPRARDIGDADPPPAEPPPAEPRAPDPQPAAPVRGTERVLRRGGPRTSAR